MQSKIWENGRNQRFLYVLWVNAFSLETLTTDYIQLAGLLNTPKDPTNQPETIAAVKQWLVQQNDWLLSTMVSPSFL
jgi:hypothetical protein